MAEGKRRPEPAPARLRASWPALRFVAWFLLSIAVFSLLFQIPWVDTHLVLPMTELIARISGVLLNVIGFDTEVTGTVIAGGDGFSINILKGCNGAYVVAIFLSAVLAFPASWKEKALGALVGIPAVQGINLVRIVSLYYVGVRRPDLFERFHYHVWQTIVILLAMGVWLAWAELLVKVPRR